MYSGGGVSGADAQLASMIKTTTTTSAKKAPPRFCLVDP
jgi:hypothetical protein